MDHYTTTRLLPKDCTDWKAVSNLECLLELFTAINFTINLWSSASPLISIQITWQQKSHSVPTLWLWIPVTFPSGGRWQNTTWIPLRQALGKLSRRQDVRQVQVVNKQNCRKHNIAAYNNSADHSTSAPVPTHHPSSAGSSQADNWMKEKPLLKTSQHQQQNSNMLAGSAHVNWLLSGMLA